MVVGFSDHRKMRVQHIAIIAQGTQACPPSELVKEGTQLQEDCRRRTMKWPRSNPTQPVHCSRSLNDVLLDHSR